MRISFKKLAGNPSHGIAFFWEAKVNTKQSVTITDQFIPELYFDYLYIRTGKIQYIDHSQNKIFDLPTQSLKTLFTRPITFIYSTPLELFGARLTLKSAQMFPAAIKANQFLEQSWVPKEAHNLKSFKDQISSQLGEQQTKKFPYPMFSSELKESDWLVHFSPRHKRRIYKTAFGLSRKELQNIHNLHLFLEQTCDFSSQNPRIIQHITADVFYDQPHLNHAFKKMTGLSPVEYFQANSILQDNLMSVSYNEVSNI